MAPEVADAGDRSPDDDGLPQGSDQFSQWLTAEGAWWATSFVFHMILICTLMLIGTRVKPKVVDDAPRVESVEVEAAVPQDFVRIGPLDIAAEEPRDLNIDVVDQGEELKQAVDSPSLQGLRPAKDLGRPDELVPLNLKAGGPGLTFQDPSGVGRGPGSGNRPGSASAFQGRVDARRRAAFSSGMASSERAVTAALHWIARHQNKDGSWGLESYLSHCKDPTCRGPGSVNTPAGATALALLPFLAAGQTHDSRGPFKANVYAGLYYLFQHQQPDGSLAGKLMYAESLATITLCEAYGMSGDKGLGHAAQAAVRFIESVQHAQGGWRYSPGEEGDTSVTGWCVMALKSAKMAGLSVTPAVFDNAKKFLKLVARGKSQGLYAYMPGDGTGNPAGPNRNMTAVAMLVQQYLGRTRDDPMMVEGVTHLLHNLPDAKFRDFYYWYYATQVLHNIQGPDWDSWNRKMRRILIESQIREDCCAAGSWDPIAPAKVPFAEQGGRLFVTSLAALTLEVYYRYLPLYKLDPNAEPQSILGKLSAEKEEAAQAAAGKPRLQADKPPAE